VKGLQLDRGTAWEQVDCFLGNTNLR